jgi:hypothetical protein
MRHGSYLIFHRARSPRERLKVTSGANGLIGFSILAMPQYVLCAYVDGCDLDLVLLH